MNIRKKYYIVNKTLTNSNEKEMLRQNNIETHWMQACLGLQSTNILCKYVY